MVNRDEIESMRPTVEGLCRLARKLGYKDPCGQLVNRDGSCVGDLLYFFEDNPGALEAVLEWTLENHPDVDHDLERTPFCSNCGTPCEARKLATDEHVVYVCVDRKECGMEHTEDEVEWEDDV